MLRVIGRLERMPASDAAPLDFLWADALDTLRAIAGAFTSPQEPPTMSDPIDHTSDEALADLEAYLC